MKYRAKRIRFCSYTYIRAYMCKINFYAYIVFASCLNAKIFIRGRIHVVSYQRSAGKTASSVYFRCRSVSRFVGYIRNSRELRLECSAYYCASIRSGGRPRAIPAVRLEIPAGANVRSQTAGKTYGGEEAFPFPPLPPGGGKYTLSLLPPFFLLYPHRVFLLLFRHIFVASIAGRRFFVPYRVAIHSRALRNRSRSDQTRK